MVKFFFLMKNRCGTFSKSVINMNKQSFLYHWKQKLESFIEIQELIATFNQLENPETSLISIIPEELFFGRESILNLLQIIISHANCQNINPFFQFFSDIKEHLVHHFSSEELFSIVEFNYIRLYLYEIGLITFESIISEAKTSFKIFRYFLIDIKENDETEFNHLIRIRFTTALNGVDIETFRENRKKMINENQIAKLIRFNNVNEFQNYRVSGGVMSLPTLEVKSIHYIYK
ncbi:hypothetical protein TRFO_38006 [Tritrichomonas foetus]|uniref:Uncharacterized protein n=1 Tax=Tritrichomonas foetus TaxID=1144522 RepID=A0A1J4JC71_9EUKA|nr:hypothetical protein TRFO_38006 [Tritrichomonas foetus]|eukprot:OHS95847.1 hypothetical protein TRFO_38006 [Tritrichomonas foetus]